MVSAADHRELTFQYVSCHRQYGTAERAIRWIQP
jgi:hypothetical protein